MLKAEEIASSNSCWNKALMSERVFTLMARDQSAPTTIRNWCRDRISRGLNKEDDIQIQEAYLCANLMEEERDEVRKKLSDIG